MDDLPDRPAQGRNCAECGTLRIVRARLTARSARSWTGNSRFDLETAAATAPPRLLRVDQARASLMIWSWVNSARPSSANSVPMPDCLAPPNGMCGAMSRCLLIQTVPASIWLATSWARLMSDDHTDAPRP